MLNAKEAKEAKDASDILAMAIGITNFFIQSFFSYEP
jgi:hypothetical protein